MAHFSIEIAGLVVEITSVFPFAEEYCRDYLTEKPADFAVQSFEDEVKREIEGNPETDIEYADTVCIFRKIAEKLPLYDRAVFHCAAISYNDKGYAFAAPSGTGKSTHICLWRKYLGRSVGIINGDKPVIRKTENGFEICSTPWAGKENWQKNRSVPLDAIGLLGRGTENTAQKTEPYACIERVIRQIYMPKDAASALKTLELVDEMCKNIRIYDIKCDMSERAVKNSFESLTGNSYPKN